MTSRARRAGSRGHAAAGLARAIALATALAIAPPAGAQLAPPPIAQGVLAPVPVPLIQDDATALGGNPSQLGFAGGVHLDYQGEISSKNGSRQGRGLFLSAGSASASPSGGFTAAASAEWLRPQDTCTFGQPCGTRLSAGVGARLGWLSLGAALHKISSEENRELDGLSTWDLGASVRPLECVALGFTALDVNGQVTGRALPLRYLGSMAVRPYCDRLVVELDAEITSCNGTPAFTVPGAPRTCGADHADLRLSGEWGVFEGVKLLGGLRRTAADERWTGEVGLQLELGGLRVRGGGTGVPRYAYQAVSVGLSSESYEKVAPVRSASGAGAILDLDIALRRPDHGVLAGLVGRGEDPLARTLAALRRLGRDDGLRVLVLRSSQIPLGIGAAEELRKGIEELRATGKKVIFYLENASDLDYYVASSADRVYSTPLASLAINGLSATAYFAAAGLDKLGVKAEFFRVGAYKNAPDIFTRSDMSAEQREVQTALLTDMASRYSKAVSERRRVDEGRLQALLDRGMVTPREAVEAGLLDGAVYPDQLEEVAGQLVGTTPLALRRVGTSPPAQRETRWGGRPRVVVIRVEGEIGLESGASGLLGGGSAAGREIAGRIRKAADDSGVVAIVVRIDSPGGDGNASDLIWRELVRARKEKGKPVVASMASVAASGGYYVAVGADAIWAEPSTITGSIGVFSGRFDASELFAKLGVGTATIKTAASADLFEANRPLTDAERRRLQALVDDFYEGFVEKVAAGRKLTAAQVDKVARGRVWTGAQALEKGLVDHLGGLAEAVVEAKRRAALAADADIELEDEDGGGGALGAAMRGDGAGESGESVAGAFDRLGVAWVARALGFGSAGSAIPEGALGAALRALSGLGAPGTLRARMPYELQIE